jgi:hypothetical protein
MLKNNQKHCGDGSNQTMAKFMHQKVMWATKVAMGATCYVALNCDEVFTFYNQF